MKSYISTLDGFSKVVKVILALPFLDILWVVYRLLKSIHKKNTLGIVLAVVLIIVGLPFLWLVDMITLATDERIIWID